ncbi:MAG: hypothetical protein AABW63_02025 [Nanoarchaeota archaeon]
MPFNISLGNFYGADSLIDLLIVLTCFLVATQSSRIYSITKEKNYRIFSWAFLTIGVAFIFKILTNLTSYYYAVIRQTHFFAFIAEQLARMQVFYFVVFTTYCSLLILGFLTLLLATSRIESKEGMVGFLYLSVFTIVFSIYFYSVFHLALFIIILFLLSHFYHNYRETKSSNSLKILIAFILILISNFVGLFDDITPLMYLADELLLLVGFSIILITHLTIKNGKKKDKAGSNKRFVGNSKVREKS